MPKRGGVPAEHWGHPAALCPLLAPCPCGGPCHSTLLRHPQEIHGSFLGKWELTVLPAVPQHGLLLGRNRRRRQQWEQNQDMSKRQCCQGMTASSPAFLDTIMLLESSHWDWTCPMVLDPGAEASNTSSMTAKLSETQRPWSNGGSAFTPGSGTGARIRLSCDDVQDFGRLLILTSQCVVCFTTQKSCLNNFVKCQVFLDGRSNYVKI